MTPTRRTLEKLKRAVRLGPATPGRTPVRVPAVHIRLGDPTLSAADADERCAARWATRLTVSSFCVHNRPRPCRPIVSKSDLRIDSDPVLGRSSPLRLVSLVASSYRSGAPASRAGVALPRSDSEKGVARHGRTFLHVVSWHRTLLITPLGAPATLFARPMPARRRLPQLHAPSVGRPGLPGRCGARAGCQMPARVLQRVTA